MLPVELLCVEGRMVHTDNHPPLIEEEPFLLAQQVLADDSRCATARGGVRSAEPQLLSGLLWCIRHDVPLSMTAARVKGGGRYQCDDSYDHA